MVRSRIVAFFISVLVVMTACHKERETDVHTISADHPKDCFTATLSSYLNPDSKVYITEGDGYDFGCWADGDNVNINGLSRAISVGNDDRHSATIDADGVYSVGGGYLAAYPASRAAIADNNITFTIGAVTEYATVASGAGAGGQVVEAPMIAYTTERHLNFENPCLLTHFKIAATGASTVALKSIAINSDRPLSGTYSIHRNGESWGTPDASGLSGHSRQLTSEGGVALGSTAKSFYLFLPPVNNAGTVTVTVTLSIDGTTRRFSKSKSGSISMIAGKVYEFGTLTYSSSTGQLTDNGGTGYPEVEPAGSEADPYLISNDSEWRYWTGKYGSVSGKYYKITDDFTISGTLGKMCGTVDGNGHTVTLSDHALIDTLSGGTVKNLTTAGGTTMASYDIMSGGAAFGCIAVRGTNAWIDNCTNHAEIRITSIGNNQIITGGIIACMEGGCTVSNCTNEGVLYIVPVASPTTYCGGICGYLKSTTGNRIVNCANTGSITSKAAGSDNIGGLAGLTMGSGHVIENSYNYANVSDDNGSRKYGIIGYNKTNCTIQNCYTYFPNNPNQGAACHTNKGVMRNIYYSMSSSVVAGTGSNSAENSGNLTNATTIYGGATNGVADQLNANITTLGISNAKQWVIRDGKVKFAEP